MVWKCLTVFEELNVVSAVLIQIVDNLYNQLLFILLFDDNNF